MNTDQQKNSPMAFAELFRDDLLRALSTHCKSVWKAGAMPADHIAEAMSDPFHAIFSFEGSLNGDLHLKLAANDAHVLASALLGQVSKVMGDAQRDALTEFLDAALPGFCESAAASHGIFTASLTVTSSPSPDALEAHTFMLADAHGVEVRLQLLLASDLAASLAKQVLARQVEPRRPIAAVEVPVTPMPYQPVPTEPVNLDLVLDVELNVTLRFGQRKLTLREVLELTSGAVIELDRQVEEPVELLLDAKRS